MRKPRMFFAALFVAFLLSATPVLAGEMPCDVPPPPGTDSSMTTQASATSVPSSATSQDVVTGSDGIVYFFFDVVTSVLSIF